MLLLLVIVAGVLLQGCDPVQSDLLMDPQELKVVVGESGTFRLISNSKLTEDVRVKFSISYSEILTTNPAEVTIQASDSNNFTQEIKVFGQTAGHSVITAVVTPSIINVDAAFSKITVEHSAEITVASAAVGWIYFIAWSVSFYPQIYENWKRKSVVGLNFDFLSLNLLGFALYSLFNCGLYWIPLIQGQYHDRHERSAIPVYPNDVFFSLHAVFATVLTILQCFIYERGGQRVSIAARILHGIFFAFLLVSMLCSVFGVLLWLDFLYYCSYVKLSITLIKYIPQGYMNYQRKSTVGWSIGNILLDFTGGTLSVLQMLLDAYNYDDWTSIFGDPTKFGLGMLSVIFDIFFMVQHYILYRNQEPHQHLRGYETLDGLNSPEMSADHSVKDTPEEDENQHNTLKEAASSEFVT